MKKYSLALFLSIVFISVIGLLSCKKINEPTTLGNNLIPGVDNIHTFEISLNTETNNALFNDTTNLLFSDNVALGSMNDPEFGQTNASVYFNISSSSYGTYPFIVNPVYATTDSLKIDSVVLSLAYTGGYGDTLGSQQTVRVFEIAHDPTFIDTSLYKFTHAPFQTTGGELGSKTFIPARLNDSIQVVNKPGDTSTVANVLRIRFNDNSLAQRFASFDTTLNANGGFYNDSLFRSLFRGLALKADNPAGNGGLCYFNLTDVSNSHLTIYFRARKNGVIDTTSIDFHHIANGQANIISRTPGGNYAAYLNNGPGPDDKIYLQSTPGSYASIKIPGLGALANKVIHRAEIVVKRIPSSLDNIFTPPSRLLIDRVNAAGDSSFILQNDLVPSTTGSIDYASFGGTLGSDSTYRFNVSRYVQALITKHEPNDVLRLYAPLRSILFASNLGYNIAVPVLSKVASGRVVLGGGSHADSLSRLRLRIIYSDL